MGVPVARINPPSHWRVKRYHCCMFIGEIAAKSAVPIKTIRYYEEIGVLATPARSPSGYREYDAHVIERLRFIRASKAIGLSLGEIREIVAFRDRGDVPCEHVLALLLRHAKEVEERLVELELARITLGRLVSRARRLRPADCSPGDVCHLIS